MSSYTTTNSTKYTPNAWVVEGIWLVGFSASSRLQLLTWKKLFVFLGNLYTKLRKRNLTWFIYLLMIMLSPLVLREMKILKSWTDVFIPDFLLSQIHFRVCCGGFYLFYCLAILSLFFLASLSSILGCSLLILSPHFIFN